MDKKKRGPTHSQVLGIVWLSVALLLIAAVAFFSSRRAGGKAPDDTSATRDKTILESQEESFYRSRKTEYHNKQYDNNIRRSERRPDSTLYTVTPPPRTKQPLSVELNSADTLTLQLVHGIGPAYARRIVRYRERLGGFLSTDQLLEVYGFTPELLAHITPTLKLDTSGVRRIPINTIELKQLAKHPYVEYYQARDIVRLRQRGVRFHTADDLRTVPSMADSTLERLLPYLDFSDTLASNQD